MAALLLRAQVYLLPPDGGAPQPVTLTVDDENTRLAGDLVGEVFRCPTGRLVVTDMSTDDVVSIGDETSTLRLDFFDRSRVQSEAEESTAEDAQERLTELALDGTAGIRLVADYVAGSAPRTADKPTSTTGLVIAAVFVGLVVAGIASAVIAMIRGSQGSPAVNLGIFAALTVVLSFPAYLLLKRWTGRIHALRAARAAAARSAGGRTGR